MITHVVQAYMDGLGFVDCRTAATYEAAKQHEVALLADNTAWMSDTKHRRTKIVPVAQSRCANEYTQGK